MVNQIDVADRAVRRVRVYPYLRVQAIGLTLRVARVRVQRVYPTRTCKHHWPAG